MTERDTSAEIERPGDAVERCAREPSLRAVVTAEFVGTAVLLLFGAGVVAQVTAGGDTDSLGDYNSIAWAWGLGVTFGIYLVGRISGAHLNPAVTLALAVYQKFPWRRVAPHVLAQTLGAFVGALLVRWNYTEALARIDPGHTIKTQSIFSTLPGNGTLPISDLGALRDQIIGTAILIMVVLALGDARNNAPAANLAPLVIGLVVVVIGLAIGTACGYAINPARDFGPRLASYLTGFRHAWRDQHGHYFFWVPIAGPLIGALVGGAVYTGLIGRVLGTLGPGSEGEPGRMPH